VYFRRHDLIIYSILLFFLLSVGYIFLHMTDSKGEIVEIYINGKLKHKYKLTKKAQEIDIRTDHGTDKILIKDMSVRKLEASCPTQLCVKQGKITKSDEMIICAPEKMIIKIVGENKDYDFILR